MPFHKKYHRSLLYCLLLISALAISACGGLGGEPRIVATFPPATAIPTEVGHPITPPDLAAGAAIFAERCTDCHGETGAGDGTLVQSGQVTNARDFTDAQGVQGQIPSDWHTVITDGRIENLMPPWRSALSEQSRWDVAFYAYTLHYDAETLARGRDIYAATGMSEGDALGVDPTDQTVMSALSDAELYDLISAAYADELSEADRWALTQYTRTLSLKTASTNEQAPESTETAPNIVTDGTVTGIVSNGTSTGRLPDTLEIVLFIFTMDAAPQQHITTMQADGSYRFEGVRIDPNAQYVTTTIYRERLFRSNISVPTPNVTGVHIPLTIYELTEDPTVIQITGVVSQINAVGESLEVVQVFRFTNTSDRAFSTSQATENGQPISLVISLPPGALIAGFADDQQRYIIVPESYLLIDTEPVMPGADHIVQVAYLVPYDNGAIIEQQLNYALNGAVRLLVRPVTLNVTSPQIASLGEEVIGSTRYQAYGADVQLAEGTVLRYDISGNTLSTAARDSGTITSNNLPLIIFAVVVGEALLILALVMWYRRKRAQHKTEKPAATPKLKTNAQPAPSQDQTLLDGLIRQIAELDAAHERGELDSASYQQQRGALKARLAQLMDQK